MFVGGTTVLAGSTVGREAVNIMNRQEGGYPSSQNQGMYSSDEHSNAPRRDTVGKGNRMSEMEAPKR